MNEHGALLIGYGLAGRVFHAPLIGATPGMEIRAIVTSDPRRQAQARADVPGAQVVATVDEAWAIPGIDTVVVASANRTHVPLALEAIEHGRHVVIDKPIAGTAEQARRIAAAAANAGVQVHPFQNRRWDSDFLTLCSVAESGELGELHRFESRIERFRPQPRGTWRESADPADLGGVLLDFGAHLVDQALELMGPVRAVDAQARSVRHANAADDDAVITLQHTNGAVSELVASQAAALGGPRFLLLGTRGAARIEECDTQEEALRTGRIPGEAGWGVEAFTIQVRALDDALTLIDDRREIVAGRWDAYYPQIAAALDEGPAPVTMRDVIANLEVLDAARASAQSGERIILREAAAHGSSATRW